MEITDSSYKLDSNEFDQVLSVLDEENKLIPLTKFNKISYILLNISTYGFIIVCILLTLTFQNSPNAEEVTWYNSISIFLLGLFIVSIPIALLFNLPLVKKIRQNIKFSREIGLYKLVNDQWLVFRRRGRFRNVLTSILALLGILITLLFILYGVFGDFPKEQKIFYLVITAFWCVIGSALVATHFIRRGKERLDILTKSLLLSKETAQQTNADQIDVSIEDYELIAQIERAQVSRSRQQSIITSKESSQPLMYYLQKSASVKVTLAKLGLNERTLVENRIDDLIAEPEPSEAKQERDSKFYTLSLSKPAVDIYYQIDVDNHVVKVFSINEVKNSSIYSLEKGE